MTRARRATPLSPTDQGESGRSERFHTEIHRSLPAALRSLAVPLEHERDQGRDFGAVLLVFVAERLAKPAFLQAKLSPQRGDSNDQRQKAAPFSPDDRRARERKQQAGIDRMPYPAVRSAAHQFVILLQRHNAAPVAAEKHPGPDGEQETRQHKSQADEEHQARRRKHPLRKKSERQP